MGMTIMMMMMMIWNRGRE